MEGETVSSESRKSFDTVSILVVDDDLTCLAIVAAILKKFKYEVVTVKHPSDALCTLRIKGGAFDLVVSDIHMPDMNGFELQQVIAQEFHLPVVLMSADNKEGVISKGLENGAAFFISKPVTPDDLRNLWQFASTKKKTSSRVVINEIIGSNYDLFQPQEIINSNDKNRSDEKTVFVVSASTSNKDISHSKKNPKRKTQTKEDSDNDEEEEIGNNINNAASTNKKPKVVWTDSLHNRFLEAIRSIGLDRSVPKKILEEMNVPGLTRENVASHLQKYRIFLRRVSDASSKISGVDEKGLLSRSGINRYSKYQFYDHRQNLGNFDFPGGLKMQAQSRFGQSQLISSNGSLFRSNIGPNSRLCGGIAQENNYEVGPLLFPGNLSSTWENPNIVTPRNNVVSSIPSTNFSDRTNYVGYNISNIKHFGDGYSRSCDNHNIGEYDNRGPEINCNGEFQNNNINLEQLMDVVNGGEQLSDVVNANHDHQENLLPPFLGIDEGIISEGQNGDLSDVFSTPIFHQLPEFDDTTANQLFADQLTIQNQLPQQGNGGENIASSSLHGSTNNRGNHVTSYDQAPDQRDDDDFLASLLAFGTFGEEQQFDGI
ncbi:hypothetical protein ACP275_06G112500 [Erythranthe tilingii]